MKKPNWNTTRFRWDEGSGRPAPARSSRSSVEDYDRRLLRRSVALFALLVIVTGAYILLRTQPSGAIDISAGVEQQATAQIAAAATDAATQVAVALAPADTPTPAPTSAPDWLDCGDTAGTLLTDKVKSAVLGLTLPVQVYLPPCYDDTQYAYPTLYLIQGLGYTIGQWVNDGATKVADREILAGRLPPFIMVMPANDWMSGNRSRYVYTSRGKGSWEDFIVNELAPTVDARYSTWDDRAGRAIGGISRGGYWSLEIAFTHTGLFSAVGGHSPAITSDYLVGADADFSMLDLVRSTSTLKTLRIFLDAGLDDVTQTGVYQLAAELGAKQVAYTGHIGSGRHDDAYWSAQMGEYLSFYAQDWPDQPRSKE
ncbi:MAG: esterase family protein [Chloroflexi bacterium]|nr:esterase family protein [Chloroflexota bacterium]MCL5274680.1 esterase family protein [Chloroflexota bacterium]